MKTQRNEQLNLCRRHLRRSAEVWEDGGGHPNLRGQPAQWHRGMEGGGVFQKV